MRKASAGEAPAVPWLTVGEHICKTCLYIAFTVHAVRSALSSSTSFSYLANSMLALLGLWAVKCEIFYMMKRLSAKLPPGSLGFPILGDIPFLLANKVDLVSYLKDKKKTCGSSVFMSKIFGDENVVLSDQQGLTWLWNNDRKGLTDSSWPSNIKMLLGPGAVANQIGREHRVLRRLLEPFFAPMFVRNYLSVMEETTLQELDKWSGADGFLSSEVFKMYALRLFYVSSFGRVDEEVLPKLHDDFSTWLGGFFSPFGDMRIPGTNFDESMKARDRILDQVDKLIDDFRRENPEESDRAQKTIVGRLIYGKDSNDRALSRDEMKDNILNLIFAGHDTTYASISTVLHHLTQNPPVMEALAEEVSSFQEPLDYEELKRAPILNAVMYEAWRIDPPVIGGPRKALKDVSYKGYTFEAGTTFHYSIVMASHNEKLYEDGSHTFRMERFLPKDHPLYRSDWDSGIDPNHGRAPYPIFGGGTHVCLGKAFAQLELRVILALMLKHYNVEARSSKKVAFPVNGWSIQFKLTKKKDF